MYSEFVASLSVAGERADPLPLDHFFDIGVPIPNAAMAHPRSDLQSGMFSVQVEGGNVMMKTMQLQ